MAVVLPLAYVSVGQHRGYSSLAVSQKKRHHWPGGKDRKRSDEIRKLTLTSTTLFLRFVHRDALERSGRGDTFSSAKTPLVIHIKTEGRAAEVEKEKSHWCGTNSFGVFPFFFISLKQKKGHFDGK